MQVLYTASATAGGGREGRVRSSDGVLDLPLVVTLELDSVVLILPAGNRRASGILHSARLHLPRQASP